MVYPQSEGLEGPWAHAEAAPLIHQRDLHTFAALILRLKHRV